jgi:hypothetical protein
MIIGAEIGLIIAGILALVRGKMTVSKNKVATGSPAYIGGVIMLLPIPLAFVLVLAYGILMASRRGNVDEAQLRTPAIIIEISTLAACFIAAMVIGAVYGKPPVQEKRRKRRDPDEDYDDEDLDRQARRRRRDSDDDEDDEPRPRSKRTENLDHVEDRERPRRPPPLPRNLDDHIKE